MFELEGIDHIALAVRDVERSAKWYVDVLGFERRHEGVWNNVPTFVGKGTTGLALFPLREKNESAQIDRSATRMLHFAMRADRKNFLAAQNALQQRGIDFEFEDHAISHSIYFYDPDGHHLEITTYELS